MALIEPGKVFVGVSGKPEYVQLPFANRHGLITGATGTGKTVSLQILAEGFSAAGVPVFCADVKGDVAGLAMAGEPKDFLAKRAETLGFTAEYRFESFPVVFWDLFGKQGHPIRATVSEMGPLLLSRLLNLNDTQEGVLTIAFRIADEEGLLLLDLKDLQALLTYVANRASELTTRYGNVSKASVGAVQRALLVLEHQGGEFFFGEPALAISDLMRTSTDGRGIINVLAADTLMQSPRLYATFLLWMLSELFDELPEIGDPEQPKLVFFFDEAHLLFNDAPKALLEKIELVVRLIRSKGVGVYFVSQNPLDIPDIVLAQIGNRVQHALRAFTPRDTKAVRAAADTFRVNPEFSTFDVITELGTGEALVSTLEEKGVPSVVQRTLVRPPSSRIGAITPEERATVIAASPVAGVYDKTVDRESAFEMLKRKVERKQPREAPPTQGGGQAGQEDAGGLGGMLDDIFGTGASRNRRLTPGQRAAREATRTAAGEIGKAIGGASGGRILRSIFGGILTR
jgi:DNA helicase HerA-like ATPase